MTQTVTGANTAITPISISVNPAVFGQPVTLSVTVSPAVLPSTGVPTGSVTFYDAGTAIGNPVSLVVGSTSSTATLTGVTLTTGTHSSVTAKYSGDANFSTVTSGSATLVVNRAATTTAVTSVSPTLATYSFGTSITLNAQVSIVSPGAIVGSTGLTGTVSFYDGTVAAANLICTSGVVTAGGNANCAATVQQGGTGVAGFTASPLVGTHNIIAVYNGGGSADANFLSSTSPSLGISIGQATTTTVVTSSTGPSPSSSVTGQLVTFTASITATGSFSAPPTGSVTFSDNGVPIGTGTVTVSGGVASAVLVVPSTGVPALPMVRT